MSGGVSVDTPVANVLWKPLTIMFKVKFGNKVETSNRIENWCSVLLMEGVTVYGHPPECHVTRGEREPHVVL